MTDRPNWDEYFFQIAEVVSRRSTCRVKVGVVAVDDEHHILMTGYNGSVPGEDHCTDVGCKFYGYIAPEDLSPFYHSTPTKVTRRCLRAVHAEQNAIGHAARRGISLEGATWYFYPYGPCQQCLLLLAVTGYHTLRFRNAYTPGHDQTTGSVLPQSP